MIRSPKCSLRNIVVTVTCLATLMLVVLFRSQEQGEAAPGQVVPCAPAVSLAREEEGPLARSEALRQHVRDACRALDFRASKNLSAVTLKHLLYDDEHKVIYCYVPKMATTGWKKVFLKLAGQPPGQDVNTMTRNQVHYGGMRLLSFLSSSNNKEEKLKTYKKFMFVGHPFVRALSAFRDKLERPDSFQKKVGQKIEKKYRGTTAAEGRNITFREFIRYISEPGPGTSRQRDEHWLPMHELCDPCSVDYDFIGTKENLHKDTDYVLQWLGVADLVGTFPESDRPVNASRHVSEYLKKLTNKEIVAFYAKEYGSMHQDLTPQHHQHPLREIHHYAPSVMIGREVTLCQINRTCRVSSPGPQEWEWSPLAIKLMACPRLKSLET